MTNVAAHIMAAGSDGLSIYIPQKKKKKNIYIYIYIYDDYELNVYLKKALTYTRAPIIK